MRLVIHFGKLIDAKRRKNFLLSPLKFAFFGGGQTLQNHFLGDKSPIPISTSGH